MNSFNPSTGEQTLVWFIGLIICAAVMGVMLSKPKRPEPRNDVRMRYHRRLQERQLGEAYRDDGYTLPTLVYGLCAFTAVLLFIPVMAFIFTAVFGMQEPGW